MRLTHTQNIYALTEQISCLNQVDFFISLFITCTFNEVSFVSLLFTFGFGPMPIKKKWERQKKNLNAHEIVTFEENNYKQSECEWRKRKCNIIEWKEIRIGMS